MSKINRIIADVKSKSSVDNFTFNLEKALEDMVTDIIEDVRTYKKSRINPIPSRERTLYTEDYCSFHQEIMANDLEEKYLKD